MAKYLGETVIDIKDSEFKHSTPLNWAMYFISKYGQIDGDHHKSWVIDQVSQILKGTPVILKQASWDDGLIEYRIDLGEPSKEYLAWVEIMKGDGEYEYDAGIAP